MYIPPLEKGSVGNEWNFQLGNTLTVFKEYSGDAQIKSDDAPYAGDVFTLLDRVNELEKAGKGVQIALFEGFTAQPLEGVSVTDIVPWQGVSLPKGGKKGITDRYDFLYETFAPQIHERGHDIVGYIIDDVPNRRSYFKLHHLFEERSKQEGIFCQFEEHFMGEMLRNWFQNRFDHYKRIFGWN